MGGCLGKKSSKYSTRYETPIKRPKLEDEIIPKKPSPSLPKRLQTTDGVAEENPVEFRTSVTNENGIDSEIEIIIDEQNIINELLSQPLVPRIVSVTDSELEYELANLIYGHPESDYIEHTLTTTANKSNDS